jgi:hypothetical protein
MLHKMCPKTTGRMEFWKKKLRLAQAVSQDVYIFVVYRSNFDRVDNVISLSSAPTVDEKGKSSEGNLS